MFCNSKFFVVFLASDLHEDGDPQPVTSEPAETQEIAPASKLVEINESVPMETDEYEPDEMENFDPDVLKGVTV